MRSLADRFMDKVYHCPITGCWLWGGALTGPGEAKYGYIGHLYRNLRAHRVSYNMFVGPIPDGAYVCHSCDVSWCVNPDHLWVGTPTENNIDKIKKGRHLMNGGLKLSSEDVENIREKLARGVKGVTLSREYSVSTATISHIRKGRTWTHDTRQKRN